MYKEAETKAQKKIFNKVRKYQDMNKEAFDRGFIKAALENGLDILTACKLHKYAEGLISQQFGNGAPDQVRSVMGQPRVAEAVKSIGNGVGGIAGGLARTGGNAATKGGLIGSGLGMLGGGAIGGTMGALTADDPEERDKRMMSGALMGALPGAIAGGYFGNRYGTNQSANQLHQGISGMTNSLYDTLRTQGDITESDMDLLAENYKPALEPAMKGIYQQFNQ